jgi:PAS domain S-box-containing protein
VLAAHGLDSLEDDPELAAIVRFAAQLCDAPVALVSLVESERQRFLARQGIEDRETPRSTSICAHTMMEGAMLVVPDASADSRFADFELVRGPFGLRFYAGAPLVSQEGAPLGALCVIDTAPRPEGLSELQRDGLRVLAQATMRRLHARRETLASTERASKQDTRIRTLADWLPDIIWSSDNDGRFDYFNGRWKQITGGDPPVDADTWRPFIHEEDRSSVLGSWSESSARGEAFETVYRLRHADGGWRWTLSRAMPVKGDDGHVARWYGTLTDVDQSRRDADSQGVIARELAHRIKNVFALISGLVSIRTRGREELRDFGDELVGTINALGKAQDFVQPDPERGGGDLKGLMAILLEPFASDDATRIEVTGDTAAVGSRAATPIALVLHELATNSVKYGALSADNGRIDIALATEGDEVVATWTETGGPPCDGDGGRGFGTRLIDLSVTSQLDGAIERDWRSEGLVVALRLPREALAT